MFRRIRCRSLVCGEQRVAWAKARTSRLRSMWIGKDDGRSSCWLLLSLLIRVDQTVGQLTLHCGTLLLWTQTGWHIELRALRMCLRAW